MIEETSRVTDYGVAPIIKKSYLRKRRFYKLGVFFCENTRNPAKQTSCLSSHAAVFHIIH